MIQRKSLLYFLHATLLSAAYAFGISVAKSQRQTSLALEMVRNRGLEQFREGATPKAGGMTLYLKAAADGKSPGDCPFAHYVRMVLEEKGLEYDIKPCVQETKPTWLIEHYGGKMPALRHRKECYVESDVIAEYLEFFFPEPALQPSRTIMKGAEDAIAGFFPSVAKYLKHTPDGDEEDLRLRDELKQVLASLEAHLQATEGDFLTGSSITLLDCSLAPKLYHMQTGLEEFKADGIDLESYKNVQSYMNRMFSRKAFADTAYEKSVIIWGWSNARS